MAAPAVSVIVPTFERRASVERLLRALRNQTIPAESYEVVVSVDGSTDGTVDMLEGFDAPYPLVWHSQPNSGRAAARNAGIARAQGDVLLFLDDDMEPTRLLLQAHLARHDEGARRCVMGAAPVVLNGHSSSVADYIGRKFNQHIERLTRAGRPLTLRDFYSGNFSVRRQVLLEVGGFDTTFKVYGNEDLELCWRLTLAGVELVFSADAVAHQHYTKKLDAVARDTLHKGQTAVLLAAKHPDARRELKLGTYASSSARRRLVIRSLLTLGRVWPGMPRTLLGVVALASRINPPGLDRAFGVTLDYLYWRGAIEAGADLNGRAQPEELRNRSLRRADWRFLLPDPRPGLAVCYGGGVLRDASALTSRTVIEPATAPERGCDLAVATMPDSRALRHAFTRLRPGGSCYVEYRGAWITPRAARRRLLAAGFDDVSTYWPWPSVEKCRAWIPLDDPVVASEYLRQEGRADHSFMRRLARASRRTVARVRQRMGLTGHVSAIGRKSSPPAARVSCVLQTGGSRCINKAVGFVFARGARQPDVVVKIARTPEAAAGLAREADTLDALHTSGRSLPGGIPKLLFRSQQSDILAIGETALGGTSITGRLARARYGALAIAGADWLAALALGTQAPPASWRELSGAALDEFETTFGEAIDPALPIRIREAFTGVEDLPSICEHRDFSPWNVLVQDGGGLSVLDWESSVQRGLPALDLIYFLSYLAFYRDGPLGGPERQRDLAEYRGSYRRAWDPAEPAGRINHDCLTRYAASVCVEMNTSVLHALRLLTWLLHGRSEYQRLAADCGRRPPPDILRAALFVNLLDEEVRIHGH